MPAALAVADRPEEHRVHLGDPRELLVGKNLARAQVSIGAEIEVHEGRTSKSRTASSTLRPSPTTSGPVPSPRITPIVWERSVTA